MRPPIPRPDVLDHIARTGNVMAFDSLKGIIARQLGRGVALASILACGSESPLSSVDAGTDGQCSTHQDCVEQHDDHWICRRPERTCVSLLSPECKVVRGDDTRDDAVFVGVLSPAGGMGQFVGAADLVREDFTRTVGGLPLAGRDEARAFVLIGCGFEFNGDPLPAARHLVETVGVPAIVGPASSSDTISVAQSVAIPRGVLVITPFAQSDLLTDLADDDLVFRTAPRTSLGAPMFAAIVSDEEATVRSERSLEKIKVALVAPRNAYGIALGAATTELLRFNGGRTADQNEQDGQFLSVSYDPSAEDFERDLAERVVVDFTPDIVVMLAAYDIRPLRAIEQAWPSDGKAPPYYAADAGGAAPEALAFVGSRPSSLRTRIRIANFFDPERRLYQQYTARIARAFGDSPLLKGASVVYDAVYALAYGIVAAGDAPLTGSAISDGMRRLVGSGETVDVLPEHIERAIELLQSDEDVDLEGASGPLDFDEHGDVTADGSIGCLVRNEETQEISPVFAGQIFRAATNTLEGTFSCE